MRVGTRARCRLDLDRARTVMRAFHPKVERPYGDNDGDYNKDNDSQGDAADG